MDRAKVILTHEQLRQILGIPDSVEIVALTISQDPLTLQVHVAGEDLPVVQYPRDEETSIIYLDMLQRVA